MQLSKALSITTSMTEACLLDYDEFLNSSSQSWAHCTATSAYKWTKYHQFEKHVFQFDSRPLYDEIQKSEKTQSSKKNKIKKKTPKNINLHVQRQDNIDEIVLLVMYFVLFCCVHRIPVFALCSLYLQRFIKLQLCFQTNVLLNLFLNEKVPVILHI